MYIVNTSFFVDPGVQNAWLDILTVKYLPFLEREGVKIISFTRVLSDGPVPHFTYSLLVQAADIEEYKRITEEFFLEYTTLSEKMFGERVTWLVTLMKKII